VLTGGGLGVRMTVRLLVLGVAILSYGAACDDSCSGFMTQGDAVINAAPHATAMATIDHCSTCAHTTAQVLWVSPQSGVTGTIDLSVFPGCFVQPIKLSRPATAGTGDYQTDFNVANCGDDISYTATVTNNSNVTLSNLEVHLDCTPFKAPKP